MECCLSLRLNLIQYGIGIAQFFFYLDTTAATLNRSICFQICSCFSLNDPLVFQPVITVPRTCIFCFVQMNLANSCIIVGKKKINYIFLKKTLLNLRDLIGQFQNTLFSYGFIFKRTIILTQYQYSEFQRKFPRNTCRWLRQLQFIFKGFFSFLVMVFLKNCFYFKVLLRRKCLNSYFFKLF